MGVLRGRARAVVVGGAAGSILRGGARVVHPTGGWSAASSIGLSAARSTGVVVVVVAVVRRGVASVGGTTASTAFAIAAGLARGSRVLFDTGSEEKRENKTAPENVGADTFVVRASCRSWCPATTTLVETGAAARAFLYRPSEDACSCEGVDSLVEGWAPAKAARAGGIGAHDRVRYHIGAVTRVRNGTANAASAGGGLDISVVGSNNLKRLSLRGRAGDPARNGSSVVRTETGRGTLRRGASDSRIDSCLGQYFCIVGFDFECDVFTGESTNKDLHCCERLEKIKGFLGLFLIL